MKNKVNKHKKANILVYNKAEFKQALAEYFRHEKGPRDEAHIGLEILFTIQPPAYDTYSNFDENCKTKFVAKVIDDDLFQIFWKEACRWNDTFHFKYTDCETLEQLNESLRIESKLKDVLSKAHKIEKAIKDLSESMDDEVLRFAVNDLNYWMGTIGHLKRQISLYAGTIPTLDSLNPIPLDERDEEEIKAEFEEIMKKDLDDNLFPKFDKVYKFDANTAKYTIHYEKLSDPYAPLSEKYTIKDDDAYTAEKWKERMTVHFSDEFKQKYGYSDVIFDDEIIALTKGFMHGPVGVHRSQAIAAEVKTFDSFEELKEVIIKLAQEKDMVLYMTFKQETVDLTSLDAFAVSDEERAKLPKKTKYIWRGYFFDKE
jgi:hypothetical protein